MQIVIFPLLLSVLIFPVKQSPADLSSVLKPILAAHTLPALAGCIVTADKIVAIGAVGVRKYGTDTPVSINDQFHLGSDTKAMTAFLIGKLVERKELKWTSTLAQSLPVLRDIMLPVYRNVTIEELLAHRSGFSGDSIPPGQTFLSLHSLSGSPMEQRIAYAKMILAEPPINTPGKQYIYSNRNYALLGIIAEQLTHTPWEKLITKWLFKPLGMKTAGFGAMGQPGKILEPWQHVMGTDGKPIPIEPGPLSDNPEVIGPAGTVHCSIGDWAKFIMLNLRGEAGKDDHLKAATIQRLHRPLLGGDYASGWLVTRRPWGGGTVLTHAGSNNQNYCVAWIAPKRGFAVLVATNIGGEDAAKACDDTDAALINYYLMSIDHKKSTIGRK